MEFYEISSESSDESEEAIQSHRTLLERWALKDKKLGQDAKLWLKSPRVVIPRLENTQEWQIYKEHISIRNRTSSQSVKQTEKCPLKISTSILSFSSHPFKTAKKRSRHRKNKKSKSLMTDFVEVSSDSLSEDESRPKSPSSTSTDSLPSIDRKDSEEELSDYKNKSPERNYNVGLKHPRVIISRLEDTKEWHEYKENIRNRKQSNLSEKSQSKSNKCHPSKASPKEVEVNYKLTGSEHATMNNLKRNNDGLPVKPRCTGTSEKTVEGKMLNVIVTLKDLPPSVMMSKKNIQRKPAARNDHEKKRSKEYVKKFERALLAQDLQLFKPQKGRKKTLRRGDGVTKEKSSLDRKSCKPKSSEIRETYESQKDCKRPKSAVKETNIKNINKNDAKKQDEAIYNICTSKCQVTSLSDGTYGDVRVTSESCEVNMNVPDSPKSHEKFTSDDVDLQSDRHSDGSDCGKKKLSLVEYKQKREEKKKKEMERARKQMRELEARINEPLEEVKSEVMEEGEILDSDEDISIVNLVHLEPEKEKQIKDTSTHRKRRRRISSSSEIVASGNATYRKNASISKDDLIRRWKTHTPLPLTPVEPIVIDSQEPIANDSPVPMEEHLGKGSTEQDNDVLQINVEEDLFNDFRDEREGRATESLLRVNEFGALTEDENIAENDETEADSDLMDHDNAEIKEFLNPETERISEQLKASNLCLKQIEYGFCTNIKYCKFKHYTNAIPMKLLTSFFCLIRDSFPQQLPLYLQNQEDKRIQRLVSIYHAHKSPLGKSLKDLSEQEKLKFFTLFNLVIPSVFTKEIDRQMEVFLRSFLTDLKMTLSDRKRSTSIFNSLSETISLTLQELQCQIEAEHIVDEDKIIFIDTAWQFILVAMENGIPLNFRDYDFFLNTFLDHAGHSKNALRLITYLTFLPGYTTSLKDISKVIKTQVKSCSVEELVEDFIPLVKTLDKVQRTNIRKPLQLLVNRCYQLLKHSNKTQQNIINDFLSELNAQEIPDIAINRALQSESVDSEGCLKKELAYLVSQSQWRQLSELYFQNVNLQKTLGLRNFFIDLFESFIRGSKPREEFASAHEISSRFKCFLENITTIQKDGRMIPVCLAPLEVIFLSQFTGTLLFHLCEEHLNSFLAVESIYSRFMSKAFFSEFPPWSYGTLHSISSGIEVIATMKKSVNILESLLKNVKETGIACDILLHPSCRNLMPVPSTIFCKTAMDAIAKQYVDAQTQISRQQDIALICGSLFESFLADVLRKMSPRMSDEDVSTIKKKTLNQVIQLMLHVPIKNGSKDHCLAIHLKHFMVKYDCFRIYLNDLTIRGLVHKCTEIATRSDDPEERREFRRAAQAFFEDGKMRDLYPSQNENQLTFFNDLTCFEMTALVEDFLENLMKSISSDDLVRVFEKLKNGAENVIVDQFAFSIRGQDRILFEEDEGSMGTLSFIEVSSKTNARSAKRRLDQTLKSLNPKVLLRIEEDSLETLSLVKHLMERIKN